MTELTPKLTDAELREMAEWIEKTNKGDRESFMLALAELALSRPRFDHSLGLIADELHGRALFEQFKSGATCVFCNHPAHYGKPCGVATPWCSCRGRLA